MHDANWGVCVQRCMHCGECALQYMIFIAEYCWILLHVCMFACCCLFLLFLLVLFLHAACSCINMVVCGMVWAVCMRMNCCINAAELCLRMCVVTYRRVTVRMQAPTAHAGGDDALQEKCKALEERLKYVELRLTRQNGSLQTVNKENGKLKQDNDELQAKYTELKTAREVWSMMCVCVWSVCV